MLCPNCGGENRDDYKFCGHCGAPRPEVPVVQGTVIVPETPAYPIPPVPPPAPTPLEASVPYAPVPIPARPRRKGRGLITCLIIFLILACLAVAALVGVALLKPEWLPFDIPFLTRNDNLIIGFPNRDGETDLYLLRLGQTTDKGTLLAEDALVSESNLFMQQADTLTLLGGYPYTFGAFVPDQNYLLYWYSDADGQQTLGRMATDQESPAVIYQEDVDVFWGLVLPNMQDLFLSEYGDEEQRCYFSQAGAEANDILQGNQCDLSYDLTTAFAVEMDGVETTANLVTLADNAEFTPLSGQENVGEVSISGDGLRLAYVDTAESPHIVLLDSQDGSTLVTSPDAYAVVDQGFSWRGHIGYYISENDDGNLELYLLSDTGATLVRSDLSIGAGLSLNGAKLVYMSGPIVGEQTLFVHDVSSGADVEVVSGSNMNFSIVDSMDRIIITSINEDELTVYSANLDGSGLVNLFNGDGYILSGLLYRPGQPYIFLLLSSDEGTSLLATRPDQADEFMVAEDWSSLTPLDTSSDGLQLIFSGAENTDDSIALYLAQLDAKDTSTLDDDADDIGNALFSARDDAVIYTAITGDNPDDAEVRRLQLEGDDPSEVLYSDAVLVAAQWDILSPLNYSNYYYPLQSTSYCPGASRLTLGAVQEAELEAGSRDCYSYRGTADETLTFWSTGVDGLDTSLTVYDRQGNFIESDDYGLNGTDPRVIVTLPEDGIYFVEVSGFNEAAGAYSLSNAAGANFCPGVEQVTVGELFQSQMNENGQVFFSVNASANTDYTFWIESTGMDPMLTIYDSEGNMINSDDNSRDGVDPLLIATLPDDGSYCLEVNTFGFETGPIAVSVNEGSIFCPGAESIILDDTVTGSVNDGRSTCYSFTGNADTTYSFVVSSPTDTDTVLELYDGTGYMINRDDDSGGFPNPRLTFTPDTSDTYYIVIRGYSSDYSGDYEMTFQEGSGFCTDAQSIFLGDVVTGFVPASTEICYSFEGYNGQPVLFTVDSPIDTVLTLYDETGFEIAYNDDGGDGLNPRIVSYLPADGLYYIAIRGYGSNSGDYTLSFETAPDITDPFEIATLLPANTRIRGAIVEANYIYLPDYDYTTYGLMYYFEGTSGQTIQIEAFGDSLGSDIDTYLALFDDTGVFLVEDDDGGVSGYDSLLEFTLTYNGRYYILIADIFGGYGVGTSYFYEILLTYR